MSKVLSIKQPWASLICTPRSDNNLFGIKDIENRSWKTKFRGRILIHASQKLMVRKLKIRYQKLLENATWEIILVAESRIQEEQILKIA